MRDNDGRQKPTDSGDWPSAWRSGSVEDDDEGIGEGRARLEPGTPDPENVVFVLTGVLLALFVIALSVGLI